MQRQGLPPRTKSYVADHVKNPQKYTCYTLDEPILVGGGDQGSAADGGQADMERVRGLAARLSTDSCLHIQSSSLLQGQLLQGSFKGGRASYYLTECGTSAAI